MLGLGNSITGGAALEDAFNIADVSGIQTWLKFNEGIADSSGVLTWTDSSGNNNGISENHGSQGFSLEVSSGALQMNTTSSGSTSVNASLTSEIDLTGAFTIFMVIDLEDSLNTETILQGSGTNFFRIAHGNVDAKFRFKFGGVSDSIVTASTAPSNGKALFRIERNGSNAVEFFEDDTSLNGGALATAAGTFSINKIGSTAAGPEDCKWFEFIVFNELVSDANIALIETDIKTRNSL